MSSSATQKFAVIIAVGPNESEMVIDTLDSVKHYYPNADVWILDDCTDDGTYEKLIAWRRSSPGSHLFQSHERNGFHYLTRSLGYLLSRVISSGNDYDFVLKIDTDTLFVAGGVDHLINERFAACGPGIVGNYRWNAYGEKRDYTRMRSKLHADRVPFVYAHKYRKMRLGRAYYRYYLKKAKKNGYVMGENVFAACYAFHIDTVRAWSKSGFIDMLKSMEPSLVFEDDVLMSIGAKAMGHELIELEPPKNKAMQLAWLEWGMSEPTITAKEVLDNGYCVIHPLKNVEASKDMRAYFRKRR